MEVSVLVFALGPVLWIASAVWFVLEQARGKRLRLRSFAAMLVAQALVIALPIAIYHGSVDAAGLSDVAGCPDDQEYCAGFYERERLQGRLIFHLGAASWIGAGVFALTMARRAVAPSAPNDG